MIVGTFWYNAVAVAKGYIYITSALYWFWGCGLLVGGAYKIAAWDLFSWVPHRALGALFFAVTILAVIGLRRNNNPWMILPQQLVQLIIGIGAARLAVLGRYADWDFHPHLFILWDQFYSILLACYGLFAVVIMFLARRRNLITLCDFTS